MIKEFEIYYFDVGEKHHGFHIIKAETAEEARDRFKKYIPSAEIVGILERSESHRGRAPYAILERAMLKNDGSDGNAWCDLKDRIYWNGIAMCEGKAFVPREQIVREYLKDKPWVQKYAELEWFYDVKESEEKA